MAEEMMSLLPKSKKPKNSDQITRDYFDSLLIKLRFLDAGIPDISYSFFNEDFSTPIMTAALSHLDRFCENGTVKMAEGAKKANAVNWVGLCDEDELKRICDTGARTVRIIKPSGDDEVVFRNIEQAEKAGCIAVGMDIDHVFNPDGKICELFGDTMAVKSADDIRKYTKFSKLPFIAKGILNVEDAVKCTLAGCAGIVLSHHHNKMIYSVPPLMVLHEIRDAVGDKIKIYVDCCVDSGMDAFKALALGADGVCAGRTFIPHMIKYGSDGVAEKYSQLNKELAAVMSFTACGNLSQLNPTLIAFNDFS